VAASLVMSLLPVIAEFDGERTVKISIKGRWVCSAFSTLTLLVGCQEEHPTCEQLIDEVTAWLSVWQMICIWCS